MKGYVVSDVEVNDPVAYEEYRRQVLPTVQKFGGKFLVRGGRTEALEGPPAKRVVVLEFDSFEQARNWYYSPEYQVLAKLRQSLSTGRITLVEGA